MSEKQDIKESIALLEEERVTIERDIDELKETMRLETPSESKGEQQKLGYYLQYVSSHII